MRYYTCVYMYVCMHGGCVCVHMGVCVCMCVYVQMSGCDVYTYVHM